MTIINWHGFEEVHSMVIRQIAALVSVLAMATTGSTATQAAASVSDFNDCTATAGETCLLITFGTGGDDLRGGGDDLTLFIDARARGLRGVTNVNQSAGWGNNSSHTVGINLRRLYGTDVPASDVATIVLSATLLPRNPFEGTDNWDLRSITVQHRVFGAALTTLNQASQLTPFRFMINNSTAHVRIDDVLDGGYEWQHSPTIVTPWFTEGPDTKGLNVSRGLARTGANNAWIRTSSQNWNAILQTIPVDPNRNYVLRGFVRTSGHGNGADVNTAFFGVRMSGIWPPIEQHFGPSPAGQYQQITQPFNPGNRTSVTVFCGFWGLGTDGWIQVDDLSVLPA
jgi:hypothetical protein